MQAVLIKQSLEPRQGFVLLFLQGGGKKEVSNCEPTLRVNRIQLWIELFSSVKSLI